MTAEPGLALAERVQGLLDREGLPAALIGAQAMVVHGYIRPTSDVDLALAVSLAELRRAAQVLRDAGLEVCLREPDPVDSLGGVVDVSAPEADLVQLVNFVNSTRVDNELGKRVGEAALASARQLVPGLALRVVDLPHLFAIKLYSWDGRTATAKPVRDAAALLAANPQVDLSALQATCTQLGLGPEMTAFLRLRGPG